MNRLPIALSSNNNLNNNIIMTNLALKEKVTFNFEDNGIEVMTLDTLKRTREENDPAGNPVRGIYHYMVIQRILDICEKYNLNHEIEEIFAAQNKNKNQPGVVIDPRLEAIHGPGAAEAHTLRRIYTTIQIRNWETEELTTNLVIAYHQDGIQVGIGPCVKICHNQCILCPERAASNYGKSKLTTEQLFDKVDEWLSQFEQQMNEDRERIKRMKVRPVTLKDIYSIIGLLTSLRVAHDSKDKRLSNSVETYPLNQGQISVFVEDLMKLSYTKSQLTVWDVYNVATEIYKPGKTDFPAMLPQNASFVEMLFSNKW